LDRVPGFSAANPLAARQAKSKIKNITRILDMMIFSVLPNYRMAPRGIYCESQKKVDILCLSFPRKIPTTLPSPKL
jgi:hypothetical protein